MKRLLLTLGVLACAAGTASVGHAQGALHLGWVGCTPDGVPDATFACNSNTGANILVASYNAPSGITALSGIEVVVDLTSASGGALPAWWEAGVGGCRENQVTSTNTFPDGAPGVCNDAWNGAPSFGGLAAYNTAIGPNRARLIIGWAVAPNNVQPLTQGTEYFATNVRVGRSNTTGATVCADCATPVCVVLNSILLAQPVGTPGGDIKIEAPPTNAGNWATWQGAGADCASVPTKNVTWGRVKSLYN